MDIQLRIDNLNVFIKSSIQSSLYDFPVLDSEIENEDIRQFLSERFTWKECFCDNGEHSHYEVLDREGFLLWSSEED